MDALPEPVDRIGELLFGRGLRLRMGLYLWAKTESLTHQGEAARDLGCPPTEAGKELDRFADLGMLQRLPRERKNERKQYLRIQKHPLWEVIGSVQRAVSTTAQAAAETEGLWSPSTERIVP